MSAKTPGRKKPVQAAGQRSKRSLVVRRKASTQIGWPSQVAKSIPLLAEDIVATIREPLLVLDEDLRVVFANRFFYKTFRVEPGETENQCLFDLGNRQWNIPQLQKLLKEILPKKTTIEHFEVTHDFPEIGPKTILFNARQVHDGGSHFILLAMEDVTKHKRMDEAVSESERKYRFLYEESFAFNVEVGLDETVLDINQAALEHLGYRKKEVLGKPIWDFVITEEKEKVKKLLAQALEGQLSTQEEISIYAKDGSVRTVLFAPKELRLEEPGETTSLVFTGMDITDRKEWEETLDFHSHALSQINDAVVAIDNDHRITYFNPGAERMYGFKRKEVMGRLLEEVYQYRWPKPEDEKVAYAALESKGFWRGENIHKTKDGKEIFVESTVTVLKNDQGNEIGLLAVMRDITERKQMEEALRHSEARLRLAQASAGAGVWDWDMSTDKLEWSEELFRLFGLDPKRTEASFDSWRKVLHPDDRLLAEKRIEEAVKTGTLLANEYRVVLPSGEMRWINALGNTIYDKRGKPQRMSGICIDVTEQKKVEAELRKTELEKSLILDNANEIIAYYDTEHNLIWANRLYLEATGLSLEQIKGKKCYEAWGVNKLCNNCPVTISTKTGKPQDGELTPKNQPHWPADTGSWMVRAAPVKDTGGNVIGAIEVAIDITERKKAEEEIREAWDLLENRVQERTAELEEANKRLKEENEERLRSEESLRLERARLDALFRLSQISEAPIAEMAAFTLEQGIALTGSEIGFVGFLSEDESVYTLHAVSKDVVKGCNVAGDPVQWHVTGAGIWAEAIRQRKTLFINDYSKPLPAKKGLPPGHPPVDRFMVVPVFEGKRIVAVAGMGNKSTDYDKSDERQIVLLLSGMWNYVQRNRSQEELQEAHDKLERRVEQRTAELRASTAALRENEERLNRAEEIANLGSWELDLINDRLSWSDEVYRIFGLVPQEFDATYEAFLEAVHPDDRKAVDAAYSGSLREGKDSYEIEHRIVRKISGEVRMVREKCEHIRDRNGRIVRSVGMVQDITEQELAERKIKDLARFPTENPNPVLRIDKGGNILYANPASLTLLKEWDTTIGGSVPSDWQKLVAEVINSGNDKTVEIEHKGKILSLQLVALPGADDVNVYGRDVTELKKATAKLTASNEELEAFTYSVSHDLRAPLRSVSGFSRVLLEEYENKLDEQGKDYLRRVRRASGRMQQLIDDLLNLSRIQRSELKHTKVNLSQLARNIAKTLTKASHRRKIDFAIKENVEATGDKNLLRVVLDNLLRNAWKFTSRCEKTKIEFGTKQLDGQTTYFVRDNGVGFDPGYADKLFVPFQRLHSESEFPGSGIGLATVKRIINRHGGRVWAEGESGKGATFYFTL